jgi:hypothetical protein
MRPPQVSPPQPGRIFSRDSRDRGNFHDNVVDIGGNRGIAGGGDGGFAGGDSSGGRSIGMPAGGAGGFSGGGFSGGGGFAGGGAGSLPSFAPSVPSATPPSIYAGQGRNNGGNNNAGGRRR